MKRLHYTVTQLPTESHLKLMKVVVKSIDVYLTFEMQQLRVRCTAFQVDTYNILIQKTDVFHE